ncbi:MAG: NADH dehydrogenase (quinone) subunit D [Phycisphaerae bacterium]|nr:NADH dehydrogenase (quinone) subunit D [Phycisphaerae bacterium]
MAFDLQPDTDFMAEAVDHAPGEGSRWILNFGPQHPATHTTIHIVLELDGEVVVGCTPHIGYLHSGFEKQGEALNWNQYVVITDRMNYISPIANNMAWHHAVEKLFGIDVPPRCKYIRALVCELARISDHLLSVGTAGLDLGAFTSFTWAFEERETINDLFEIACGQRFHTSYSRVGGLMYDLPDDFWPVFDGLLDRLPRMLGDFETLLTRNRIFIERTKGIGVLSKERAISYALTGPLARASGIARDLRKDEPYFCYDELDFKVPVADGCDCYARYLVRLEEIRQSMSLLKQIKKQMPPGAVNVPTALGLTLPPKKDVYGSIEGLIYHFELVMTNRGFKAPIGESYGANETANGELGFYLVSAGQPTAYRARCRPPSFIHMAAYPEMLIGHVLSDAVAVLGSLNIIAAELDR